MEISWSQTTSLACPRCDAVFEAELWLIVDTVERSDLLERVRNGTLHEFTCPNCNQTTGQLATPLLLYRPNEKPALLFSPAPKTTAEQDQEHVTTLVGKLRERLSEARLDARMEQVIAFVPRPALPAALDGNTNASPKRKQG